MLEILHKEWFNDVTQFPKDSFPCKVNCDNYHRNVNKGYETMKTKRIVFAGLCMNIEETAKTIRKRIEHFGSFFKDYKCVIFENDSKDNTRKILKDFSNQNNNIIILDCPESPDCMLKAKKAVDSGINSQKRMRIMADYRNRLIDYINRNLSDYDCVCFLDLDITGPIYMDGVAHSFGLYNVWDSVSAFGLSGISMVLGKPLYYDILAFNDKKLFFNEKSVWLNTLPTVIKMSTYKIGDDLIEAKSGFCGMAFYKMDILKAGVNYTPLDNDYKCEHLIFHDNMILKGFDRIFIDPNMIVLVGVQGNSDILPNH